MIGKDREDKRLLETLCFCFVSTLWQQGISQKQWLAGHHSYGQPPLKAGRPPIFLRAVAFLWQNRAESEANQNNFLTANRADSGNIQRGFRVDGLGCMHVASRLPFKSIKLLL